jgi:hypothetical protein
MPVKFKPSQTTMVKGQGKVTQNFYIKNTPKEELIDYLNNGQKPKIKQKCLNELTRRGIEIVWNKKQLDI